MKKRFVTTTVATAAIAATALATIATSGAQAAPSASGAGSDRASAAIAAARAHGSSFGLDADQSLTSRSVATDRDGTTHVRLDRTFKGLPVVGGDLVVHTDKAGAWKGVDAASSAVRVASTTPSVAPATAAATAARSVDYTVSTSKPTLAVYAMSGPARLVWKTQVDGVGAHGEPAGTVVFVDARSGTVVDHWATVINDAGTGNSLYLGTVTLQTTPSGGQWQLIDATRGSARTEDGNNGSTSSTTGTLFTDADNTWGTGSNTNRQTAAVDADFGVGADLGLLQEHVRPQRHQERREGRSQPRALGTNYVNASWSDTCFCMTLRRRGRRQLRPARLARRRRPRDDARRHVGHGRPRLPPRVGRPQRVDLGRHGHHGRVHRQHDRRPWRLPHRRAASPWARPSRCATWTSRARTAARLTAGARASATLDVHYSSGVGNHFFYLLSEGSGAKTINGVSYNSPTCNGSTVTGIGRAAAAKIWYRALTTYMTSSTNYAGARTGMLSAAKDLYGAGSAQYSATAAAWSAVNVN